MARGGSAASAIFFMIKGTRRTRRIGSMIAIGSAHGKVELKDYWRELLRAAGISGAR